MYTNDTTSGAWRAPVVRDLPVSVALDVAIASTVAVVLAGLMAHGLGLTMRFPALAAVLALAGGALLVHRARLLPFGGRLGGANRVTLGRAALAVPVVALVPFAGAAGDVGLWVALVLAAVVLALDGVDGWVARRTGTATAFGARFDMELDALLLLGLSALAWQSGQVGAWVLVIGAMRYGFVAAGWGLPRLAAPLPPSFRRKTACVVQGVVLTAIVAPVVPGGLASAAAAVALVVLAASFAVDTRWLLRRG